LCKFVKINLEQQTFSAKSANFKAKENIFTLNKNSVELQICDYTPRA
jgi:hypothetical protein